MHYALSKPLLLNPTVQISQMIRVVEQDNSPARFILFEDIDAGVVLLELPKGGEGEA